MEHFLQRLRLGGVAKAFTSWQDFAASAVKHHGILAHIVMRNVSMAFETWTLSVAKVKAASEAGMLVEQMVATRLKKQHMKWWTGLQKHAEQMRISAGAFGQTAVFKGFHGWRRAVDSIVYHRSVVEHCVRKLNLGGVAKAFTSWQDLATTAVKHHDILARVFLTRRAGSLAKALHSWHHHTSSSSRRQCLLVKHIRQASAGTVARVFGAWADHASYETALHEKCLEVLSILEAGKIYTCFTNWHQHVCRQVHNQKVVSKCVSTHQTGPSANPRTHPHSHYRTPLPVAHSRSQSLTAY